MAAPAAKFGSAAIAAPVNCAGAEASGDEEVVGVGVVVGGEGGGLDEGGGDDGGGGELVGGVELDDGGGDELELVVHGVELDDGGGEELELVVHGVVVVEGVDEVVVVGQAKVIEAKATTAQTRVANFILLVERAKE